MSAPDLLCEQAKHMKELVNKQRKMNTSVPMQLALKLHPDKNAAPKAEDAFKAVSRAFSCLSDADKRAYYDRTGYDSTAAAAAAASARGNGGGGGGGGPGGVYYAEDFDPQEIFNMFFG